MFLLVIPAIITVVSAGLIIAVIIGAHQAHPTDLAQHRPTFLAMLARRVLGLYEPEVLMTDTSLAPGPNSRRQTKNSAESVNRGTRQARRAPQPARHPPPGMPRGGQDEWLTVEEVCAELKIGRRTFERWRTLGLAPRATRPTRNGPLKIKRGWLEEWAEDCAS